MRCVKLSIVSLLLLFFIPMMAHGLEKHVLPMTSFHEVADYIKKFNHLPDNFITKSDAKKLGWDPARGNLWVVAPGKSIGGDVFHNREKTLPGKGGESGTRRISTIRAANGGKTGSYFPATD